MFLDAEDRLKNLIEMLYIQAMSKLSPNVKKETDKNISQQLIEKYLKRRGYTQNYILNRPIMVNGFVCVYIGDDYVEIWHDSINKLKRKSVFINEDLLTGLPITLNYMERI